jgi:protein-S-isoprenylcysteine O-methyltransferase Ste14
MPNWLGWLLMESVSVIVFASMFIIGSVPPTSTTVIFLIMWEVHYLQRSFIYPFLMRDGQKKMPLVIALLAAGFNLGNAYINGRYLFHFSAGRYTTVWLLDQRFIIGMVLFISGFCINLWADHKLRSLRQPGETGYKIPYGGLYRYISCPNYLGEILEWTGWAIATWSLPGLAFAIWTFANLAPRAQTNHKWYHEHFEEYPSERKALIPGVW